MTGGPEDSGPTLGVVGGGQLGRMLAMAAARLDVRVTVLDPTPDAPAAQVANEQLIADYDDVEALAELARRCDRVTFEFENVPAAGLDALNAEGKLQPNPRALSIAQDRLDEKAFIASVGLSPAPYRPADDQAGLESAVAELSGAAILKTRRLGYDGKGQLWIGAGQPVPADAFERLGGVPLVVEAVVDFTAEISVIGARGSDGSMRFYEPARNSHRGGILARSVVPCGFDDAVVAAAWAATEAMLIGLDYVGVIGVEFFVGRDGRLTVNEFAPRVHNSGHWTEAACLCSQFEQHVRAVLDLPLGDPFRHSDAEMENLLGDPGDRVAEMLAEGDWMVHLYGKAEARPGRKMGHATRLGRPRSFDDRRRSGNVEA
ncbi:MAG: 5-(carboxyamino)imidazole ribonucleotide synthase [Acidimicrobiia bacterium]|nr:5-(carboxyamino)imidazole ribonucleotide synthase [Acidimicrobiia bacterium]